MAAVLLGSVVWVGISGRVAPPPENSRFPSTPAAVAVATEASPIAEVPTPTTEQPPSAAAPPTLAPRPTRRPAPTRTPFAEDIFLDLAAREAIGVIAVVDGRQYLKVLQEIEPGRFEAAFRLPYPVEDGGHRLQLAQLWTRAPRQPNYAELGDWPLSFGGLSTTNQPGVPILAETIAARPRLQDAPRVKRRGFSLTLRAENWDGYAVVRVVLILGPVRD